MKISKLIKKLERAKKEFGDIPVLYDYDGNYDKLNVTHVIYADLTTVAANTFNYRLTSYPEKHILLFSRDFINIKDIDYKTKIL